MRAWPRDARTLHRCARSGKRVRETLSVKRRGYSASFTRAIVISLFLLFVLSLIACSTKEAESFVRGTVYLTIFQPDGLSYDHVTFEVQLANQTVRQSNAPVYDSEQLPTAIPPRARAINSPNNVYVAAVEVKTPRSFGYPHGVFLVKALETQETIYETKFRDEEIHSIVWSPGSDAVAVLTSSQRYSLSPKYWFRALSGHPKPFEKYRLEIVDVKTHSNWGIDIPYQSSAGFGEIRAWLQ